MLSVHTIVELYYKMGIVKDVLRFIFYIFFNSLYFCAIKFSSIQNDVPNWKILSLYF